MLLTQKNSTLGNWLTIIGMAATVTITFFSLQGDVRAEAEHNRFQDVQIQSINITMEKRFDRLENKIDRLNERFDELLKEKK